MAISGTKPKSWVVRHQRLEGYVPGLYAVQVEGLVSCMFPNFHLFVLTVSIAP